MVLAFAGFVVIFRFLGLHVPGILAVATRGVLRSWSLRQIVPLRYTYLRSAPNSISGFQESNTCTRVRVEVEVSQLRLPSGARSRPRGSAQLGLRYHRRGRNFRGDVVEGDKKTFRVISNAQGLIEYSIVKAKSLWNFLAARNRPQLNTIDHVS